jgi:hypothetical protein
MSQIIACKTADSIVLAADSKAVDVDANGNLIELGIERLQPLSQYSAILTGGAAAGEAMCTALKHFVASEDLFYIDEINRAALPLLSTEYERFMRRTCETQPIDPIHQVTFILAGYTPHDKQKPFQMHLIWTKKKLPMLDSDEIDTAFSVPRLLKVEHRLNQLVENGVGLDGIMTEVRREMEVQAANNEEVSGPLSFAWVTADGFKRL